MDLHGFLIRRFFTPLYEWKNGASTTVLKRRLLESQYLSADQILENQFRRFKETITYAYQNCTYYRERFDGVGLRPEEIVGPDDIPKVPLLSKDDIRENLDKMIAQGFSKETMIWKRTGGSTGVPVQLYWDEAANLYKSVLVYRHDGWAGCFPWMKGAALWGDVSKKLAWKAWLFAAIFYRTTFLDTLQMDEPRIREFIDQIRRRHPRILFGHGHSLYFFAKFLAEMNITDINFDSIISSAEMLPPEERRVVEEVFGDIVFDRYGCEEVSIIASECEAHDGMHIAAEGIYFEVLDGDETTPGRIVITDLVNRGMPLIRYEIGDLATTKTGPCSCGRNLPRLGEVVGRTTDILFTPEGKKVSGISVLDTFTIHIPGFRQVQIVQESFDELIFNIVKSSEFGPETMDQLAESVATCFGPTMKYQINFVEQITRTGRGKFQFSICKLQESDLPRK